ncbi:hypothetical protein DW083_07630 [Parabacteroides sp. AF48-14]|nr:hypothetical protein DW083_07630 [Parabacteroides sp. AF48-14]
MSKTGLLGYFHRNTYIIYDRKDTRFSDITTYLTKQIRINRKLPSKTTLFLYKQLYIRII